MSMTIGVISGMVALGVLGTGYYLYNSKYKSYMPNSKPEIKVKESKEQEIKLSQKTYAPLNYIPKNTKPISKPTYSSNSNKSHKSKFCNRFR